MTNTQEKKLEIFSKVLGLKNFYNQLLKVDPKVKNST